MKEFEKVWQALADAFWGLVVGSTCLLRLWWPDGELIKREKALFSVTNGVF
jgi:hypothetical protein